MKKISAFERECESQIKEIIKKYSRLGLSIRRENLTRGPSFKVRSGRCTLTGGQVIFIDRRLSAENQLSILNDELKVREIASS
ncbi:MAG TPA: hypothetical protein PKA63_08360 [Oligoflexia bacterium]|nr:hypothetical protein [Oligoflexia bacterium]HMP48663.1 hypothetical protein [Oligoflexia bacterium]